jgi:predicted nucleic acid-binding protein
MRFDRVVANASPLICLFRCGLEGLLGKLWGSVAVPEGVWQEVVNGPKNDRAATGLLGAGESEVLAFAIQNPGTGVIVDDGEARRCARALSIPHVGTGGVLVVAKRRGIIPSVSDALADLRKSGLWLADSLVMLLKVQAEET